MPNRLTQTGTTNVPGPRVPLYLLGHQLVESHPYVPVFAGVRVATGIFSYLDTFSFGITADFDSFPDVDVIADGIRAGFNELVAAAEDSAQQGALGAPPGRRARPDRARTSATPVDGARPQRCCCSPSRGAASWSSGALTVIGAAARAGAAR